MDVVICRAHSAWIGGAPAPCWTLYGSRTNNGVFRRQSRRSRRCAWAPKPVVHLLGQLGLLLGPFPTVSYWRAGCGRSPFGETIGSLASPW